MTDIEQYIKELEDAGIIDQNGAPIKCRDCGTSDFDESSWGDIYLEETKVTCKHCKKIVGHRSYGTWQIV
jgi:hypothetical protein